LFNNFESINNLRAGSAFYVFQSGFLPIAEDVKHAKGGKFTIEVSNVEDIDNKWLILVMSIIGESVIHSESVVGLQFGSRKNGSFKFTIWTIDADDENANLNIGKHIKEVLKYENEIWYERHGTDHEVLYKI
jgi:hypothetical protein